MAPGTGGIGGAWTSRVYAEACVVRGLWTIWGCSLHVQSAEPCREPPDRPPVRGGEARASAEWGQRVRVTLTATQTDT